MAWYSCGVSGVSLKDSLPLNLVPRLKVDDRMTLISQPEEVLTQNKKVVSEL